MEFHAADIADQVWKCAFGDVSETCLRVIEITDVAPMRMLYTERRIERL